VIDFGDTLEVSVSSSPLHDTLTCDAAGVPLDASNLILRAFDLFRRKTGSKQARARSACGARRGMRGVRAPHMQRRVRVFG
jgi:4-diphosphocytidyl-2C-methyl-D-erythritol kinase